ncbi:MAG: hypothetical protein ACI4OI_04360 [Gemmiger sp.]
MWELRFYGGILVTISGWGIGYAGALHARDNWKRLHTFVRLLEHLRGELSCRVLPGDELLAVAAQLPEFQGMALTGCRSLAEIPVPDCIDPAYRTEIYAALQTLCIVSRERADQELERLLRLCRAMEQDALAKSRTVRALYPRLGFSLGLVASILLA